MFRVFALFCLAVAAVVPAQASVTHTVKFGQGPVVLAWQDGQAVGQGERVTLKADAAATLTHDWAGGGVLQPMSYTSSPGTPRVETLTLASNAAVSVRFDSQPLTGTVEVRLISVGAAAQYGGAPRIERDYTFGGSATVLTLSARTARKPGSPSDQSVSFEIVRTGEAAALPLIIEAHE